MKYFIDFEATQFSQEIISIGCVNEKGEEFFTLVKPTKGKITEFITSLTGITKEMIETKGASADDAFSWFWDWISEDIETPEFICYGNCDKRFVQNTLKYVKTLKAQAALLLIDTNIKDFAPIVSSTFKLAAPVSLRQLYEYYFKPEIQKHDAMEDANWLKAVFENFDKTNEEDFLKTFNKYTKVILDCNSKKVYCPNLDREFPSIRSAGTYIYQTIMKGNNLVKKDNVVKRLSKCIKNNTSYCGMEWKLVEEEGVE